jgi:ribosome-associated translation inhibitor RaiA
MTSSVVDVSDVEIVVRGDLPESVTDYARDKIITLVERLMTPVLHARIRLTHQPDPAVARPVRAQANLDVNGRLVRAQVAASTGHEAVDLLVDRLRQRLVRLAQHWEALRGRRPSTEPHEWQHGAEPTHRPPYYPRPIDERQILRHKSFTPARVSPAEAAWEMDQMDYDFHLFTDDHTGGDAVVYRGGSTGYRLGRLDSGTTSLEPSDVPLTISPHPAPRLTVSEARDRLEIAGQPFMFFADASTGRGCVLYHRYDGHYGLITPAQ